MVKELNYAVASLALHFSSMSSSSSFFFLAAGASRTCLSSCSSSMIRYSFTAAFFSRLARLLARSAKDYQQNNKLVNNTSTNTSSESASSETYCQRMVDGHDAGPQGLDILIVIEDIILPRSVIPVNFSSRQPWARQRRVRYLCARRPRTS
jgi:hypothetical protein